MNDFRTYWTCLNQWAIPVSSYDLSKHPKRIFEVWKPMFYLQCVLNPFHVHHGIVCPYMIYCMQLISLLVNLLTYLLSLMWRHSFWAFMVWFLLVTHSDVKLNKFLTPAPLLRKTLQLSLTSFSGLNIVAYTHTHTHTTKSYSSLWGRISRREMWGPVASGELMHLFNLVGEIDLKDLKLKP